MLYLWPELELSANTQVPGVISSFPRNSPPNIRLRIMRKVRSKTAGTQVFADSTNSDLFHEQSQNCVRGTRLVEPLAVGTQARSTFESKKHPSEKDFLTSFLDYSISKKNLSRRRRKRPVKRNSVNNKVRGFADAIINININCLFFIWYLFEKINNFTV